MGEMAVNGCISCLKFIVVRNSFSLQMYKIFRYICGSINEERNSNMRVSASVENLWQYIQSLSLSANNRKWLAERLLENKQEETEEAEYISKEEILTGIDAGLREVKLTREGKLKPKLARELLDEL